MMNFNLPKRVKYEIEQFNRARIEALYQIKFDELIESRSVFFRSGELTNAEDLIFHVLDEFIMKREEALFDALIQKTKSHIHPVKIGHYVSMLNDEYEDEFNKTLNRFTHEFLKGYSQDGKINWRKLARL